MTLTRTTPKQKRSFTLSRSSVVFLEDLRKERGKTSTSLVLDELIQEAETQVRRTSTEKAISDFYSSLSPEDVKEQAAWSRFALTQFPEDAG